MTPGDTWTTYKVSRRTGRIIWELGGKQSSFRLNYRARVATLVRSIPQPEGLSAASLGNVQTTRNGDLFVGWGILPYISEFSHSGRLLFNAGSRLA